MLLRRFMMRYARSIAIIQRHGSLYSLVQRGMYSSPALAEKLGVSEQTIYRDILFLREQGLPIRSVRDRDHWAYVVDHEASNPDRT
jgi:predicted DNA-binding transcriptional regulator YafY